MCYKRVYWTSVPYKWLGRADSSLEILYVQLCRRIFINSYLGIKNICLPTYYLDFRASLISWWEYRPHFHLYETSIRAWIYYERYDDISFEILLSLSFVTQGLSFVYHVIGLTFVPNGRRRRLVDQWTV